jgi:hypothetical protein
LSEQHENLLTTWTVGLGELEAEIERSEAERQAYRLQLHPTETRFVGSRFKRLGGRHPATAGTTFNFLGFTHVWGRSSQGKNVVRQITAKDRYAHALASVMEWCRPNLIVGEQHAHLPRVLRKSP